MSAQFLSTVSRLLRPGGWRTYLSGRSWRSLVEELCSTPEGREAYEQAKEDQKFEREQMCAYGNCVEHIDTRTNEYKGGWGPVECPCQN